MPAAAAAAAAVAVAAAAALIMAAAAGSDDLGANERLVCDDVLQHFDKVVLEPQSKQYAGATLAYVTPWNAAGYDIARQFRHKFTYIAPVWYQVGPRGRLRGAANVDQRWMASVSAADEDEERGSIAVQLDAAGRQQRVQQQAKRHAHRSHRVRIVPRFILEEFSATQLLDLAESADLRAELVGSVVHEVQKQGFDGIVLEATQAKVVLEHAARHLRKRSGVSLIGLFTLMADALHAMQPPREFILVASPHQQLFSHADFRAVASKIDRLSLMTYDYSVGTVGPISPISWMNHTVQGLLESVHKDPKIASKVMMGLNFYGQDFVGKINSKLTENAQAILGRDYINLLETYSPQIKFDRQTKEHFFEYSKEGTTHTVFFPSLQSLQARLQLSEQLGVSISIWEIGQGLDYWYDLL